MKKSCAIGALLFSFLLPSAFAFGAISYGEESPVQFAIPDAMGVVIKDKEADHPTFDADMYQGCIQLICRMYSSTHGWNITIFSPSDYHFANYDKALGSSQEPIQKIFSNFQDLLAGTKKISDFFDERGVAREEIQGVFDISPEYGVQKISYATDIWVIYMNREVVGYTFTPLLPTGDFPPSFQVRRSLVYLKDKNVYMKIDKYLTTQVDELGGDDLMMMLFQEKGKKDPQGNVDWSVYTFDSLIEFLAEHSFINNKIKPINPEYNKIPEIVLNVIDSKPQQTFSDVGIGSNLYDAISYVKFHEFVEGYPDGSYKPENKINRAEFVKILVSATNDTDISKYGSESCFSDVMSNAWYTSYVCYAKAKGIIAGYADGTFGVGKNVNLAEALKIVMNAYNLKIDPDTTSWYAPYFKTLDSNGVELRFDAKNPNLNISRAEMAELILHIDRVKDNPFAVNE